MTPPRRGACAAGFGLYPDVCDAQRVVSPATRTAACEVIGRSL